MAAIELDPNCHPLYRLRIIASAGLGDFASALEGESCGCTCCNALLASPCSASILKLVRKCSKTANTHTAIKGK